MKHILPAPALVCRSGPAPASQRGVVLVITLVLLVVFALLGAFAIRNATQSERVMNGLRTNATAQQAAETALRFCEQVAQAEDHTYTYADATGTLRTFDGKAAIEGPVAQPHPSVRSADQEESSDGTAAAMWRVPANWAVGASSLITVPQDYYKATAAQAVALKHPPQCVIQRLENVPANLTGAFVITARGYANDAVLDAKSNKVSSGAEVWLQSVLIPD